MHGAQGRLLERPPLQGRRLGGPEGLYRTCTGDEGCRKRGRRGCLGGRGAANAPLPRVASKHLEVSARSSFGRDRQLRSRPVSTAEQWTTPALKIPFWESVHGEPRGPATGCAATARRARAADRRRRGGVGEGRKGSSQKERWRGCMVAPQSKVGGGGRIPWCSTGVQEMDVRRERETVSLS